MKSYLQFTLRELLFVIAFAGFGLASLVNGGIVGAIMVSLAMIITMGLAIVAFVGRRSRQAFAIGFLIPVIMYAAIVLAVGKNELDPYAGQLPTWRLLRPMFAVMSKEIWQNAATGQIMPDYDFANDPNQGAGMRLHYSPDRQTFMSLGHLLIAMMLGYAGAKLAVIVHRRESKDNEGRAGEYE